MFLSISPLQRRIPRPSRLSAACGFLFVFALLLSTFASAQRRDFPATYRITQISEQDNSVELTLSLTVHNYSGAAIEDCGIVLKSSDPFGTLIGTFDLVKFFPSFKDISVSNRFTVPRAEYERWMQGARPNLDILLPDGEGGTVVDSIDPRPEPVRPEATNPESAN